MKALLLCPDRCAEIALLSESGPLAVAPLLGKSLVEYWIEYLASKGVREIIVVTSDRPALIDVVVGNGSRWGLSATVAAEPRSLNPEEAVQKFCTLNEKSTVFVVRMDHLPGQPEHCLLTSYAAWFSGLKAWMPRAQALERIGQCEIRPGIWVGLRSRIDPSAVLLAPCWIGDYVSIRGEAVVGPFAILESGSVVAAAARIEQTIVGPATFVGPHTLLERSIACHNTLINWASNSVVRVPDAFWLSGMRSSRRTPRPETRYRPTKLEDDGSKMSVTGPGELNTSNSAQFLEEVQAAISTPLCLIEIDLKHTDFIDSCGLATLCRLHRIAISIGITVRLIEPRPAIRQLLELTQMHLYLDIRDASFSPSPPKKAPVSRFIRTQEIVGVH